MILSAGVQAVKALSLASYLLQPRWLGCKDIVLFLRGMAGTRPKPFALSWSPSCRGLSWLRICYSRGGLGLVARI